MNIDDFDFTNAKAFPVGDGSLIKYVWVEDGKEAVTSEKSIELPTGRNALIEFANGSKMLITNSEWCSLNILD